MKSINRNEIRKEKRSHSKDRLCWSCKTAAHGVCQCRVANTSPCRSFGPLKTHVHCRRCYVQSLTASSSHVWAQTRLFTETMCKKYVVITLQAQACYRKRPVRIKLNFFSLRFRWTCGISGFPRGSAGDLMWLREFPAECGRLNMDGSIQRLWTIFRDLVICIGLWWGGNIITLLELLDFNLETVSQMVSEI